MAYYIRKNSIKPGSYFSIWLETNNDLHPYRPDDELVAAFLKRFDDRLTENSEILSIMADVLNKEYEANGDLAYQLHHEFYNASPRLQRTAYENGVSPYRLIPAGTYKAIISRYIHKNSGRISRGVSTRVLEDCIERIFENVCVLHASTLAVHYLIDLEEGEAEGRQLAKYFPNAVRILTDKVPRLDQVDPDRYFIISYLFVCAEAWASVVPSDDEDNFPIGTSDRYQTWKTMLNILNSLGNDPTEDEMVMFINRFLDVCHERGPLAGAFVEGGAGTCSEVSNMKPDELYESSKKYSKRQISEAIRYWKTLLKESR